MSGSIVVIGSANTDMVVKSSYLPRPGETILGGDFIMTPGGKGANQAVAAAKLGGDVTFIARLGDDTLGHSAIEEYNAYGIDTSCIIKDAKAPSGVALIMVDEKGENCISVASGANANLSTDDIVANMDLIKSAGYILVQLETPLATIQRVAAIAIDYQLQLVLNPAPAQELSHDILKAVSIITPNQTEAALLSGVEVVDVLSAKRASAVIKELGVSKVIITMGAQGAYVSAPEFEGLISSPKVVAVDTTAAGDTFNGALVVALAKGKSIQVAAEFANLAAALSVTKIGAQSSIPTLLELKKARS